MMMIIIITVIITVAMATWNCLANVIENGLAMAVFRGTFAEGPDFSCHFNSEPRSDTKCYNINLKNEKN